MSEASSLICSVDDIKGRRHDPMTIRTWHLLDVFQRQHDDCTQLISDEPVQIAFDCFRSDNAQRVERCAKALGNYDKVTDGDTNLTDLLADAMNWCRDKERDFQHLWKLPQSILRQKTYS